MLSSKVIFKLVDLEAFRFYALTFLLEINHNNLYPCTQYKIFRVLNKSSR